MWIRRLIALCAMTTVPALTACGDSSTSPQTPNITVFLSATPIEETSAQSASAQRVTSRHAGAQMGALSVEDVDSINIELFGIAAIQPGDNVNYAAAMALTGAALHRINFRTLPEGGTDSVEVARDRVPGGMYNGVRLRFKSASITFNRAVTVKGTDYPAGTYPLDIPQGLDFAANAPSNNFVIDAATPTASVSVSFDVASSVAGMGIGVTGMFRMAPIFRAVGFSK